MSRIGVPDRTPQLQNNGSATVSHDAVRMVQLLAASCVGKPFAHDTCSKLQRISVSLKLAHLKIL